MMCLLLHKRNKAPVHVHCLSTFTYQAAVCERYKVRLQLASVLLFILGAAADILKIPLTRLAELIRQIPADTYYAKLYLSRKGWLHTICELSTRGFVIMCTVQKQNVVCIKVYIWGATTVIAACLLLPTFVYSAHQCHWAFPPIC